LLFLVVLLTFFLNDRCDLFRLWTRGSRVLGTKVGSKLFVTMGFKRLLHFIPRFANERTRRLKHPVTLGATEALKVSFLNPYPLAWHCRSISLTMCKRERCAAASAAFRGWRSVTNSMLVTLLRGGVHLILANPPWRQLQERAERFRETRSTWG